MRRGGGVVFQISDCDIQNKAVELIGRKLNGGELRRATKMVEDGLSEHQWEIIGTAVEAVEYTAAAS